MQIQINEKYRISSDPSNIIVQELKQLKPREGSEEPRFEWKDLSYHRDLEQACISLIDRVVTRFDSDSVEDLKQWIETVKEQIVHAIRSDVYETR